MDKREREKNSGCCWAGRGILEHTKREKGNALRREEKEKEKKLNVLKGASVWGRRGGELWQGGVGILEEEEKKDFGFGACDVDVEGWVGGGK